MDQRDALLEEIDQLPARALDREKQLEELQSLVSRADTEELLTRIRLAGLLESFLKSLPPELRQMIGISQVRDFVIPPRGMEFIVGMMVCQDTGGSESVTYRELSNQFGLLNDAYQLNEIALYAGGAIDEHRFNLRRGLIHRELTTGRFHEPEQAIESARHSYRPFDDEMRAAVGYTIDEALAAAEFLLEATEYRTRTLLLNNADSFTIPDEFKTAMNQGLSPQEGVNRMVENSKYRAGAEFVDTMFDRWNDQLDDIWFDATELVKSAPDELDTGTLLEVVSSLSVDMDNLADIPNSNFDDPFSGPNPIESHPIIELDGKLMFPSGGPLIRALAETYYYRLRTHMVQNGRKTEFGKRWGIPLEDWTRNLLSDVFEGPNLVSSAEYTDKAGERTLGEVDALAIHGDSLIVIECKTKKLPVDTRTLDVNTFEEHLDSGVGKAVGQVSRFIRTLRDRGELILETPSGEVTISASDYEQFHAIVVLRDWYDHLATVDYTDVFGNLALTPYVVDIYSFEMILNILDTPVEFERYISARRRELAENNYFSMDEIDYLGLYLKSGRSFPKSQDNHIRQIQNYTDFVNQKAGKGRHHDVRSIF
jgi:hypothetical protein